MQSVMYYWGTLNDPLMTTLPVLTEAFHLLDPCSRGVIGLRQFVAEGYLSVWWMEQTGLHRAFELMGQYSDHPMDFTDASLIAAAEALKTQRIFTLDLEDFFRLPHQKRISLPCSRNSNPG